MKMIGLIGGMSCESSAEYYRMLNQGVREQFGPKASAPCLLWSFEFLKIEELQRQGDWAALARQMVDAARKLEASGAELLLICSNTMHVTAPAVQAAVQVPLLHIADATAERVKAAGFRTVGLLGTRFTMEQDFYKGRLSERHGIDVIVPAGEDRATIHRIIYEELVAGEIRLESRHAFRDIMARLIADGAEAIILGCTEIMLLVRPEDSAVPIFDTTAIHAQAAVEFALGQDGQSPGEIMAGAGSGRAPPQH